MLSKSNPMLTDRPSVPDGMRTPDVYSGPIRPFGKLRGPRVVASVAVFGSVSHEHVQCQTATFRSGKICCLRTNVR